MTLSNIQFWKRTCIHALRFFASHWAFELAGTVVFVVAMVIANQWTDHVPGWTVWLSPLAAAIITLVWGVFTAPSTVVRETVSEAVDQINSVTKPSFRAFIAACDYFIDYSQEVSDARDGNLSAVLFIAWATSVRKIFFHTHPGSGLMYDLDSAVVRWGSGGIFQTVSASQNGTWTRAKFQEVHDALVAVRHNSEQHEVPADFSWRPKQFPPFSRQGAFKQTKQIYNRQLTSNGRHHVVDAPKLLEDLLQFLLASVGRQASDTLRDLLTGCADRDQSFSIASRFLFETYLAPESDPPILDPSFLPRASLTEMN